MIKVENLNKYFNKRKANEIHVINNTTISFPNTGLVAVVGESGSGKTTLMNVIGGLDSFDSGTVYFDDVKINKFNSSKIDKIRNENVGYIFQNFLLLLNRTVKYNLSLSLGMYNLTAEEENERIDYVLNAIGMLKFKNKLVSELSGGQRQRVAIARALIKSPKVILADEPTGNLDEKNTIQIMNIIKKISKTTLVILVSHERHIARSYADWIIEVSDGKVTKNELNSGNVAYHRVDDQTLYLKDYDETTFQTNGTLISFYKKGDCNLDLKIIFEGGKYYLSSSEALQIIDEESEVKIKDEHRQDLKVEEELNENDYVLDKLQVKKKLTLPFKEKVNLAFTNISTNKKRRFFLSFALMVISILVLLCIQSIISAKIIDIQSISVSDSRIYNVTFEKKNPLMNDDDFSEAIKEYTSNLLRENPSLLYTLNIPYEMTYTFDKFTKLQEVKYSIKAYSFMPLETISDDDLYLGRLPKALDEIVVDRWVLENCLKGTTLQNVMGVGNFLDKEFHLKERDINLKIVGISKTNENAIYINKWLMLKIYPSNLIRTTQYVAPVSEFNRYLGKEVITSLSDTEAIVNEEITSGIAAIEKGYVILNDDDTLKLNVKGGIKFNGFPYKIIVSDNLYEKISLSVIGSSHDNLSLICNDESTKEDLIKYLNNTLSSKINISHESKYDNLLKPYYEESEKLVSSRTLIVATIIIVSIILVYFSMRSYAIKNIYDIGVYRAIGISKGSIIFIYAFEILLISLSSTLIGTVLCFIVTNFLTTIPILTINIAVPFGAFIFTTIALICLNVLVGILPVALYMRLTPSQIISKYDI